MNPTRLTYRKKGELRLSSVKGRKVVARGDYVCDVCLNVIPRHSVYYLANAFSAERLHLDCGEASNTDKAQP